MECSKRGKLLAVGSLVSHQVKQHGLYQLFVLEEGAPHLPGAGMQYSRVHCGGLLLLPRAGLLAWMGRRWDPRLLENAVALLLPPLSG